VMGAVVGAVSGTGGLAGVICGEGGDGAESPPELWATTVKVYDWPATAPSTQLVAFTDDVEQVAEPG